MKKLFSGIAALAALAALTFASAPAKAQGVETNAETAVIQLGGVFNQTAGAVADAYSAAHDATAAATAFDVVNLSDVALDVDVTSYHMGGYGAVDTGQATLIIQAGLAGGQAAAANAKAAAQLAADATANAINGINMSTVAAGVKVVTSRH